MRLAVALLLVAGLSFSAGVYYDTDTSENWEGAVSYVEANERNADIVVAVPSSSHRPVEYYYTGDDGRVLAGPEALDVDSIPPDARIWVVSRYPSQGATLRERLGETRTLGTEQQFGSIRVTVFE